MSIENLFDLNISNFKNKMFITGVSYFYDTVHLIEIKNIFETNNMLKISCNTLDIFNFKKNILHTCPERFTLDYSFGIEKFINKDIFIKESSAWTLIDKTIIDKCIEKEILIDELFTIIDNTYSCIRHK